MPYHGIVVVTEVDVVVFVVVVQGIMVVDVVVFVVVVHGIMVVVVDVLVVTVPWM